MSKNYNSLLFPAYFLNYLHLSVFLVRSVTPEGIVLKLYKMIEVIKEKCTRTITLSGLFPCASMLLVCLVWSMTTKVLRDCL